MEWNVFAVVRGDEVVWTISSGQATGCRRTWLEGFDSCLIQLSQNEGLQNLRGGEARNSYE